ncbi:MAG TPA: methyltransferase domain-containing protein [Anditalea sp.]|nr:methyltransferase domain-containing protein [Anditalea sp.]
MNTIEKNIKEHQKNIVSYYENTWLDYRVCWMNRKNRAVHFGYFNEDVKDHNNSLENLNQVMANKISLSPGDIVLDAGCGQGGSSFWIAEKIGAKVKGITLVPHQVEIANKDSFERNLTDKVSFSIQDYCNTSFADETFSVIWACESLCHTVEKANFYKEAYRLLKPGGRLIVAEYIRKDRPLSAAYETLLKEWLSGWSIPDIDTWDEHCMNMGMAGFTDIDMQDVTANILPSLRRLYRLSQKLLPLGEFLHLLKVRNDVKHANQVGSIKQYIALKEGIWFYSLFSAYKA